MTSTLTFLLAACNREAPQAATQPQDAPYVAVARGRIDVEGGVLSLAMPLEGRVNRVEAHEGDRVAAGQELAAIDDTEAKVAVRMSEAKLERARILQRGLAARLSAAQTRTRRLTAAAQAGAGDGQSADDAQENARQLQTDHQDADAGVRMAEAELEQARYQLERHRLRSPLAADVIRVNAQPGATVSPQSPALFTLLPAQDRIVRAELNQSFLSRVRPGMSAQILSDDDTQTVVAHARVKRLAAIFGPSTIDDGGETHANERSVECVLSLDKIGTMRVGQRVLVRFLR